MSIVDRPRDGADGALVPGLSVRGSRDSGVLLRRYHVGRDPRDLDVLVRRFRPLARRLALRYARGSDPVDDLEQIACMGLIKALDRFDPDRGFAFTSFAVPTILGELKRSFRDTAWSAHVPRALQERVAELRAASDEFSTSAGRAPTVNELSEVTGIGVEDVVEALRAAHALSPLSMDAPRSGGEEDDDGAFLDRLGGEDSGYDLVDDRQAIEQALPSLTGVQRRVLELRFQGEMKQSEIAAELGVSQMQVSRVLRSALGRLAAVANHHSRI